ncbi:hypothetical protein Droror1_Dr00022580 [Drosera rotundifolia]
MGSQFRCVNCGNPVDKLYIQYSPGNIRLSKCEACRSIADEYIECEPMIVFIDLILHKPKAYRHLLFNTLHPNSCIVDSYLNSHILLKSLALLFFLDACRAVVLVLTNNTDDGSSVTAAGLKIVVGALLGNLSFLGVFAAGFSRRLLNLTGGFGGYKDVLLAVVVSSCLKFFMVAMLVWDFPAFVVYVVDLFVLSSNLVALRVISKDSPLSRCVAVCFAAHSTKLLFGWMINLFLV